MPQSAHHSRRSSHSIQQRLAPKIEVTPALDAAPVDEQAPARLTALRADPSPAPEPDRHEHSRAGEADVDDRCARQAQKPVECCADAHVALLGAADLRQPAAFRRGGGASLHLAQPPNETSNRENPAHAAITPRSSPPDRAETPEYCIVVK